MTRWFLVLGFLAGCSFALTGPDSKASRSKAPTCDTSKSLVVIDMIAATVAGIGTLAASGNSSDAIAPALITALFAGSALRGNFVVQSCRQANDEYLARANPTRPTKPPPAIAEEADDEQRPPPRVAPAPPEPPVAADDETPDATATPPAPDKPDKPDKQPPAPPKVPPPIQLWVDFWKEIR